MKISKRVYCLFILLTFAGFAPVLLYGQQLADAGMTEGEIEGYKPKVEELIAFVEYCFNTVGSEKTPTREKDIIITQSFRKAFKDEKVQVEDDLVEGREVVTNKDVQAYLKDVDFFFEQVKFEFHIDEIIYFLNENNQITFKVTTSRNMAGITSEGKSVNSNQIRYIEVNLDQVQQDLKIASIYTTKTSETEALNEWWRSLSPEWMSFFRESTGLVGVANTESLRGMKNLEKIDISGNPNIKDLIPLGSLTQLKELKISKTKIASLAPLRNLNKLQTMDCSNTDIKDLEPLKYALGLKVLNLSNTPITDFKPLENFKDLSMLNASNTAIDNLNFLSKATKLKTLFLSNTKVKSLVPVKDMRYLVSLNCSSTQVNSLVPLSGLTRLERLNVENTQVADLSPLRTTGLLKTLYCDNTQVASLQPLKDLKLLERIYCDNTLINNSEAKEFMLARPKVLVIFGSEDLKNWWSGLSTDWRSVFKKEVQIDPSGPTKEQFAAIASMKSIDISGNPHILNLDPLETLRNLKRLKMNQTNVKNLSPIKGLFELEVIEARQSQIVDLTPLDDLSALKKINIDATPVPLSNIKSFARSHPKCLVVYKSDQLGRWWLGLSDDWKAVLKDQLLLEKEPNAEQLHLLIGLEKLTITNQPQISSLAPLQEFANLKDLEITGTQVTSLTPLSGRTSLEKLNCSRNPIVSLDPLANLKGLKFLDCSNTPVEDLEPIENLGLLRELRFSGTQVKDMKSLSMLSNLRVLDCFNTDIKELKSLKLLYNLKSVKCYNTKLSRKNVEAFKKSHPRCEVVYY